MVGQLLVETELPVPPKPERGTLGEDAGRDVGVDVVGVAGRVVIGVAVRVKAGRDQWLLLLVRVQPEPPQDEDRRCRHCSALTDCVGVAAAGRLLGAGQSRGGVIA
jgi:hypothetical protein